MSPRTFDDIPVSTVFAEEKSRENSDTRKSTTSLKSQNSRKISRESRDSKKSKKSEKSEKSNQSENEPDSESVETAKKLKKQLEDTIRKHFRNTVNINRNCWGLGHSGEPSKCNKVGCGIPIVVASLLLHAEFGSNDHREDASHFIRSELSHWSAPFLKCSKVNYYLLPLVPNSIWRIHQKKKKCQKTISIISIK